MKRWLKSGAFAAVSLWTIALCSLFAQAGPTSSGATNDEQIAQLLDQLGVRVTLEQAPLVLAEAFQTQMQLAPSAAHAAIARRDLDAPLQPPALIQAVTRYLREHYSADTFRQAQQRLQEPLAKRARYFDLAMTQPGAEKNLRDFLSQVESQKETAQKETVRNGGAPTGNTQMLALANDSAARRELLGEIDAASAASLLTATLQSAIAARTRQTLAPANFDAALFNDEIAERQRYLAPLAINYLLYDYRYLRDDELRDYRDLLRDDSVQALLDLCRQAVLNAILGDVMSPPLTPPRDQPR